MKLKILMISDLFPPVDGGVPTVLYELSKRLTAREHKVVVATYQFQKDWPDYEVVDGIEVFRVPLKWNKLTPFYLSAPFNMKSLINSLSQKFNGFDILHLHLSLAGFGALTTPQTRKVPKVFTFYGDWAKEYLAESKGWKKKLGISTIETGVMRFMQRKCLRSSHVVVTLSKYSKEQVLSLTPHPPAGGPQSLQNKVQIIPAGVDLEKFQLKFPKLPNLPNLPKNKFLILTIRRLYKRMGLENLIDAIDIVRKEFPEVFLIIGGKGYLEESLKLKVKSEKLEKNVRLEGFIPEEEKSNYLRAAHLYVLPSVSQEGFGLTTLESLACGTPVLGTPTGATPELLGNFRKEFILMGTSAKDIAKGIIEFMKKYRGDESLRLSCREYAKGFSWEKMVGEYEELYFALSTKHKAPSSK